MKLNNVRMYLVKLRYSNLDELFKAIIMVVGYRDVTSPHLLGGRTYCFWFGFHWCRHQCDTFLSAQYLVNQCLDYQIFMDIYLGHDKELIRIWRLWSNFQGHSSRKTEKSVVGRGSGEGQSISYKIACVPSEDSDQPVHPMGLHKRK